MPLTRRRFIAASGTGLSAAGAAAVLGACGGDPRRERSDERDAELLAEPRNAAASLAHLYEVASGQALEPEIDDATQTFGRQARTHVSRLGRAIEDAGGPLPDPVPDPPAGESVVEAIRIALEQSVAACHGVLGELSSTEARRVVYEVMVADAGQLAAVRGFLGEEQVPEAFVTGGAESPLEVPPAQPEEEPEDDDGERDGDGPGEGQ